jgi:hypothetical protein
MPGTGTVYKTWSAGDILTAADQNASFAIMISYMDPTGSGPTGTSLASWRNTSNPYPNNLESLPASLLVELQQVKYVLTGLTGNQYWYQSPGWSGSCLLPSAGSLLVSRSNKDLLDRNANPLFAAGVPNNNATGSTILTQITGIPVTNGDIILVQSMVLYTLESTSSRVVNLSFGGVTATTLNGKNSPMPYQYDGVSGHTYQIPLSCVVLITQTGNLIIQSGLDGSPTGITNSIGYAFLKKQ